jgi:hypothetical protein
MKLDIETIKAREQVATPGPWGTKASLSKDVFQAADVAITADRVAIGEMWEGCPGPGDLPYIRFAAANAEFIAHARTDLPELVAEVERLRAALEQYANYGNWQHEEGRWMWLAPGEGPDKAQWALEGDQT